MFEKRDSYSQYGEDLILLKLFADAEALGRPGNLIDVGAYEPEAMSNSRLLIEHGWDATLIEFSPMAVKDLARVYACTDNVRVIQAALTTCPQGLQEFRVTDDGLSSHDPAHLDKWKDFEAGYYGKLWVPTLSVRQLIDQFYGDKALHFVNIDTEGTSVDLAVEFMRLSDAWHPAVLCVEYDDRLAELATQAQKLGYRQEWIGDTNVILVAR